MNASLRPATESDYEYLWWLHGATMRTYVEAIWGWDEAVQRLGFAATEETETHITMSWPPQTIAAYDKGEPR